MDNTQTPTVNEPAAEASSVTVSSPVEATPVADTSDAAFEQIVNSQNTAPAEPSTEVAPAPVVEQPVTEAQPAPEHQPRPAQRRIQELLADNKALREQLSSQNVPVPQAPLPAPKLSELVQGKDYVDPAELDQLGQQLVQQGAQAASGTTALEVQQLRNELKLRDYLNEVDREAMTLSDQYPELKDNPELEAKIAEDYKSRAVRVDPVTKAVRIDDSVKLADVAKSNVEFYRAVAEASKAQASATLDSQVDSAAVTPNASAPAPEKNFDDMSLSEQEAYLRAKGHNI